jgi:nucleoid-associated protein YgaU
MNLKRGIAAAILAAVPLVGTGGEAFADTTPPDNWHIPATCDAERWHDPAVCVLPDGTPVPWTISIAEECRSAWRYNPKWAAKDSVCRKYAPKARAKWVTVKRGQTLWRLAVIHRGNGHEWRVIAKLNHVKGTTIYAGQRIRVE